MGRISRFANFPRYLKQVDAELGCIPTNIAAVLQSFGISPVEANEANIIRAYLRSICFEKVANSDILGRLGQIINRDMSRTLHVKHQSDFTSFFEWWDTVADWINNMDTPVLFSFCPGGSYHIRTAVGAHPEKLETFDPWPCAFSTTSDGTLDVSKTELEAMWPSNRLAHEILVIAQA